ncbi:serine/threonine protein kinase [Calothrix sp. NIES-4071]|nr:serine/threonine protein kinase [Calothrix sp. NIES-4071]BAZ63683.1 serine/threonine protein kinase [Calothrix sp. NIES-4105]
MLQTEQIIQNRYKLERQLGNNAARQTWLATDLSVDSTKDSRVVVKLLAFGGTVQWDDLKLFEREAQILKHLEHPKIPKYIDYFSIDDRVLWFGLVEEYIPGNSLKELLVQGKRFSEKEVKKIATEVLNILIYLHKLNPAVLHRDIKPSNLILGEDNDIYLVDFGAVQDKAAKEGVTFTVVGTYGYAPMEQFGGKAVPASDLYGLGATIIHLLTGIPPADLPVRDLKIQFHDKVNIKDNFITWIEKIIEPSVERRLSSATVALEALESNTLNNSGHIFQPFRKPIHSLVQIRKTPRKLNIILPRKRIDNIRVIALIVKYLIIGTLGLGFLTFTAVGIVTTSMVSLAVSLPLVLIWLAIIDQFVISDFGNQRIFFNEEQFGIELWIFTFRRNIRTAKVREIRDVFQSIIRLAKEDNLQLESHQEKEMITIQTDSKRFSFGIGLSAQECMWIAQEIKDWLHHKM